jgi:signal transduction histidine kinase
VFLAVALCLPLVAAAVLIEVSIAQTRTGSDLALLSALAVVFVAVVVWAALAPSVRQVEVSAARALLGFDEAALPDVGSPRAWTSRARGAAWLALLVGVGIVVTAALVSLVPTGLSLLSFPLTGNSTVTWPLTGGVSHTGAGWHAVWLVGPGLLALAACGAVVLGAARLLVSLAPRMLGPTLLERVGIAAERERALARANALARDLHDQLGHTLTAMTVQVTAARRLMSVDPQAAERSLSVVEDLGRRAQADVDRVVCTLRDGMPDGTQSTTGPTDLADIVQTLVDESSLDVELHAPESLLMTDDGGADVALGVIREALTNATRHGTGSADVLIQVDSQSLRIEIRNPIRRVVPAASTRAGLTGLRERVLLAGGEITAGPNGGDSWLLSATLPISRQTPGT